MYVSVLYHKSASLLSIDIQGPPNNFFILENTLKKKTAEYFLKFLFLFESKILAVNNEK